jgi:hypothetical protein
MLKGTITVVDGMPVMVEGDENLNTAAATPDQSLHFLLKTLASVGWVPDGELPLYRTTGTYTIPIRKL